MEFRCTAHAFRWADVGNGMQELRCSVCGFHVGNTQRVKPSPDDLCVHRSYKSLCPQCSPLR